MTHVRITLAELDELSAKTGESIVTDARGFEHITLGNTEFSAR